MPERLIPALQALTPSGPPASVPPRAPEWDDVEKEFLRENPACAACGGTYNVRAHHILPYHLCPEKELDPENLLPLCEASVRMCHYRIGHGFDWAAYYPDVRAMAAAELARIQKRLYTKE